MNSMINLFLNIPWFKVNNQIYCTSQHCTCKYTQKIIYLKKMRQLNKYQNSLHEIY